MRRHSPSRRAYRGQLVAALRRTSWTGDVREGVGVRGGQRNGGQEAVRRRSRAGIGGAGALGGRWGSVLGAQGTIDASCMHAGGLATWAAALGIEGAS